MTITHYCSDGSAYEVERGRYLSDAEEWRSESPCGCIVYHDTETEHL